MDSPSNISTLLKQSTVSSLDLSNRQILAEDSLLLLLLLLLSGRESDTHLN